VAKNDGKTVVIYRESDEGHGGHHGGSWKVAYADFVTAMMAFFLLLWLVVSLKPSRKQELSLVFQDKNVASKEKVQNLEKVPTFPSSAPTPSRAARNSSCPRKTSSNTKSPS